MGVIGGLRAQKSHFPLSSFPEKKNRLFERRAVESVDPALRRPGRFDQVVWMGPPDEGGRKAIFLKYLEGLRIEQGVGPNELATRLARITTGLTGADIAFATRRAALLCVKKTVGRSEESLEPAIRVSHFEAAVQQLRCMGKVNPAVENSLSVEIAAPREVSKHGGRGVTVS